MTNFHVFVSLSTNVTAAARQYLASSPEWRPHPSLDGIYFALCPAEKLRELCYAWVRELHPNDLQHIRCHVSADGSDPAPGTLMHSRDLKWLMEWLDGRWLRELLHAKRLVTYFQPIVELKSRSSVFAFECLSRGRDKRGELIPPDLLFRTARATGQLAALDHAAQLTAVQTAADKQLDTHIFINFSPRYLDQSAAALEETIHTSVRAGLPSERLIFEVVESDRIRDFNRLTRVLRKCRDAGSRVALDDVGAGYNSLALIVEVRPDFIKIDRDLIRGVDRDVFKCRVASKLIELARDLEIDTVIEGIESEAEWEWALNQGAHYGQGFLLGLPSPDPVSNGVGQDDPGAPLPIYDTCDTIE